MNTLPQQQRFRPLLWLCLCLCLVLGAGTMTIGSIELAKQVLIWPLGLALVSLIFYRPFLGLLLITAFVPLDGLTKILFPEMPLSAFKVLTIVTLAGVIFNNYREPLFGRPGFEQPLFRLALMFGLAALISSLYAIDSYAAHTSLERYLGLLILLYLVISLVQSRKRLEWILLTVVISTAISASVVLIDWTFGGHLVSTDEAAVTAQWGGISRSAGASNYNPTTAAIMMLTGTCLALMLFWRSPRWRWLTAAAFLVGSIALLLSFARSAAVVYALMLLWLMVKIRHHRRAPAIYIIALIMIVSALPWLPADLWERLGTLANFDTDRSLWRRLSYNIIGWDLFVQNPMLGVGPGNFPYHFIGNDYRWMPGRYLIPRELHNTYLEVLAEIGILGFSCFMGMLLVAFRGLTKTIRTASDPLLRYYAEALQFAFLAFLLASVFMPHEYNKYLWIFAGLAAVITQLGGRVKGVKGAQAALTKPHSSKV